jgi:hypothetical protein
MILRLTAFFILTITIVVAIFFYTMPLKKANPKFSVYECFKKFPYQSLELKSLNNKFTVKYISNSPSECINPLFPSIQIESNDAKIDAWLQIIYTDSNDVSTKLFIDSYQSLFPLYTRDPVFYDAPLWNISSSVLPLSYWKAHTYALKQYKQTFSIIGAIKWGFAVEKSDAPVPELIFPEIMTDTELAKDLEFLSTKGIKNIMIYNNLLD